MPSFHWLRARPALHAFPTRRSSDLRRAGQRRADRAGLDGPGQVHAHRCGGLGQAVPLEHRHPDPAEEMGRSEEHTSELQSRGQLVCRLLLEKKNKKDLKMSYAVNLY